MSRPAAFPSPSAFQLACVLLALAVPALASRDDMVRSLKGADADHAQLVFGQRAAGEFSCSLSGLGANPCGPLLSVADARDGFGPLPGAGCTTYQLSFPEECCPSSYTRVRSHHSGPRANHRPHPNLAARPRKAAPTLDPSASAARARDPSLSKRRLDVDWLAPLHHLDHLLHPYTAPDASDPSDSPTPPPSPTRTASSTPHPRPNPARPFTYAPAATAAPVADSDPGQVGLYAVDDAGCQIERVYRQAACPSGEGTRAEEGRQVMELEMWRAEGGGRAVEVECGRVGTFWY